MTKRTFLSNKPKEITLSDMEIEMNKLYSKKYRLPEFTSCTEKQLNFAISCRNKLFEDLEKSLGMDETLKSEILEKATTISDAGKFLDDFKCAGKIRPLQCYILKHHDQIKLQETVKTEEKQTIQPEINETPIKSETFIVYMYDEEKISVCTADNSIDVELANIGFQQKADYFWELESSINSADRTQKENLVRDTLINNEKTIRIIKTDPKPKPAYHDATILKDGDKLIAVCRDARTYNAFSRIGARTIDITDAPKEELKEIIRKFDVGFADKELEGEFQ